MVTNYRQHKRISFRFRRWSRRPYAAFVSLKHTVTIGTLPTIISDRIGRKANRDSIIIVVPSFIKCCTALFVTWDDDDPNGILQIVLLVFLLSFYVI
jgi:hypothetical protein